MSTHVGEFDAIVVGSGATGGWAAMDLTSAGLSTLVLEAGAVPSLPLPERFAFNPQGPS